MNDGRTVRLALLLPAAGWALFAACPAPPPPPQPGCTRENCQLMIDACRVEFGGMPADIPECTGIDRPTTTPDWLKYCVDACNAHQGNGELASCLAAQADACLDAGFNTSAIIQRCVTDAGPGPEQSCDDTCTTERRACDDKCSGGRTCDQCLRMGGSCASVCSDAGWQACLDCSGECGLQFIHCEDACPRAP